MADKQNNISIKIAANSGFCKGVKGIIEKIETALERGPHPVFVTGAPAHNPRVIDDLDKKGLGILLSVEDAPEGSTVVIRAHGIPPEEILFLKSRNITLIDATCPRVKIVHRFIMDAIENNRTVIIAGDEGHAELRAHVKYARDNAIVIFNADSMESLEIPRAPATLLAQTTFDPVEFVNIEKILVKRLGGLLEVRDTICSYTIDAQDSAISIARSSDVMIVIGGRDSANTIRLADRCRKVCQRVVHIEAPDELDIRQFYVFRRFGIAAGSSTPPGDIQMVADIINSIHR